MSVYKYYLIFSTSLFMSLYKYYLIFSTSLFMSLYQLSLNLFYFYFYISLSCVCGVWAALRPKLFYRGDLKTGNSKSWFIWILEILGPNSQNNTKYIFLRKTIWTPDWQRATMCFWCQSKSELIVSVIYRVLFVFWDSPWKRRSSWMWAIHLCEPSA